MFLPIGDSPNPKSTPWVTWTLIAVNVAVFVSVYPLSFMGADPLDPYTQAYARVLAVERGVDARAALSAYDIFLFKHGFKPAAPRTLDLFVAMFLHGGFLHIAGNMLFLWIYGDNVEDRLGRLGYLVAYLGTGLAAGLGDGLLRPGSGIPSVGASGAISGVLGMYFLWFPRNRVRVWVFLFPLIATVMEFPARLVLGIFIVLDNVLPMLFSGGGGTGVAYGAHLGGFAAGLAVAWGWDRLRLARPEPALRAAPRPAASAPAAALLDALDHDRLPEAYGLLAALPRARARSEVALGDKLRLARALETAGHPRAALAVYQRILGEHSAAAAQATAHIGAARVLAGDLELPTAAYQHLLAALESRPSAADRLEARRILELLRRRAATVPRQADTLLE
ncbi:MAG: rhomboid family intramembrane serine protease [Acidobacteriota bacterium]|nr:rhomboid family intramembrane serine protease [Acidobacteriota bacterium]MDQ7088650.1 rhomboid family intramembrane serine protease [Acidobacteriota bacterium]